MGYIIDESGMQQLLDQWQSQYVVYGPVRKTGEGMYSNTDVIRYDIIQDINDIEFHKKSDYSFKEVLLPITQTLFYYTENEVKEAEPERKKGAIIFLRSCDLHAVKRIDEIYLKNSFEDHYYKRLRDNVKFVVMGCKETFENCFCVSMGTNKSENYDLAINAKDGIYQIDCQWEEMIPVLAKICSEEAAVKVDYVVSNKITVTIPDNLSLDIMKSTMWEEYNSRCINCGRCNFVCPTCTCFSMQDISYTDNGKAGERRRVHASCMVDGFTDMAGGHSFRQKSSDRMRFKVLHKVYDFNKRYGYHMCVGCGRCDDVCPEYISFSNCINKLKEGMEEVTKNDAQ